MNTDFSQSGVGCKWRQHLGLLSLDHGPEMARCVPRATSVHAKKLSASSFPAGSKQREDQCRPCMDLCSKQTCVVDPYCPSLQMFLRNLHQKFHHTQGLCLYTRSRGQCTHATVAQAHLQGMTCQLWFKAMVITQAYLCYPLMCILLSNSTNAALSSAVCRIQWQRVHHKVHLEALHSSETLSTPAESTAMRLNCL